jgi:tetratricopeptide (TPR) repeat protein
MNAFLFFAIGTLFADGQPMNTDLNTISARADQRQISQDFAGAERLRREALRIAQSGMDKDDPRMAPFLVKLAVTLNAEEKAVEAEEISHRAYSIAWNANDKRYAGLALSSLGVALIKQGQDARAEPVLRRGILLIDEAEGKGSMDAAMIGNSLVGALTRQHEFSRAEKELAWVLPVFEKAYGANDPQLVLPLTNMTTILISEHRASDAEPYLNRALNIARKAYPNSMKLAALEENEAALEAIRGNYAKSAQLYRKVLDKEELLLGPRSAQMTQTLQGYDYVMNQAHRDQQARLVIRRPEPATP